MKRFSLTLLVCLVFSTAAQAQPSKSSKLFKLVGQHSPSPSVSAPKTSASVDTETAQELDAILAATPAVEIATEKTPPTAATVSADAVIAESSVAANETQQKRQWSSEVFGKTAETAEPGKKKLALGQDTISFGNTAAQMAKGFFMVLGLLIVGVSAVKRFRGGSSEGNAAETIKIISKKSLSQRSQLMIVEVDRKRLLMAQTGDTLSLVTELSSAATAEESQSEAEFVLGNKTVTLTQAEPEPALPLATQIERPIAVMPPKNNFITRNMERSEALSREALALLS